MLVLVVNTVVVVVLIVRVVKVQFVLFGGLVAHFRQLM
jgi:hypothetical protein